MHWFDYIEKFNLFQEYLKNLYGLQMTLLLGITTSFDQNVKPKCYWYSMELKSIAKKKQLNVLAWHCTVVNHADSMIMYLA